MQNQQLQTSSSNSLAVSDAGIAKALRYLGSDQRPMPHTRLVPPHVCDAVIARHSDPGPVMADGEARKAVLVLLAGYPGAFTADPGERLPYMEKIRGVFCMFPAWAVAKVTAPGFRFAGNPSFRPNDKEIAEALDGIMREFRAYATRARWHKEEGERRAAEARMEAAPRVDVKRISELVGSLRTTPFEEPIAGKDPQDAARADGRKRALADIAARRAAMTPEQLAEHDATIAALKHKPGQEKAA